MANEPATWQRLPDNFKRDLVNRLDFRTRSRLRRCSSVELLLVDSCPAILNNVTIEPEHYPHHVSDENMLTVADFNGFSLRKVTHPVDILHMLTYMAKHKRSRVGELHIKVHETFQLHVSLFINLYDEVDDASRLGVEKFVWCSSTNDLPMFMQMFRTLRPAVLRHIVLGEEAAYRFPELTDSEQWKRAERIDTIDQGRLDIRQLDHCHVFSTKVVDFNVRDIWNVVKTIIAKNPRVGARFHIFSDANSFPMDAFLATFDVQPENRPIVSHVTYLHTQQFCVADPRHVFIVVVLPRGVQTLLCRRDNAAHEFVAVYPTPPPPPPTIGIDNFWLVADVLRRQQERDSDDSDEEEIRQQWHHLFRH